MKIGGMRQLIRIQRATRGSDSFGSPTSTWSDVVTVHAEIVSNKEPIEWWGKASPMASVFYKIVTRYRSEIAGIDVPMMRILWGDKTLSITGVTDPDGRRVSLNIFAFEAA
jgi:head-tail adaptor